MIGLLPLLLAIGGTEMVVGAGFNRKVFDEGNVEPKIMGYDAYNVLMLGGAAVALLFGGVPWLAAAGITAATTAYTAKTTKDRVVANLGEIVKTQVQQQLQAQQGQQLQLPGPDPLAPSLPPAQSPAASPGGLLSMLFGPRPGAGLSF